MLKPDQSQRLMVDMDVSDTTLEDISFSRFLWPVIFISIVLALTSSAIGIQRSILAIYSKGLNQSYSNLLAGAITLTLYGSAKAIGNYIGGFFSDKLGRKRTIFMGTVVIVFGTLSFLYVEGLVGFVLGNGLLGAGAGFVYAGSTVALTDYSGIGNRSKAVSLMELSVYLGTAFGSFIPSILSPFGSFFLFFQVSFGIAVAGVLLAIIGLRESKEIVGLETETFTLKPENILHKIEVVSKEHGIKIPNEMEETFAIVLEKGITPNGLENEKLNVSMFFKPTLIVILMTGVVSRLLDTAFILVYPLFLTERFGNTTTLFAQLNTIFVLFWAIGIFISPSLVKIAGRRFPLIFGVFAEFALFYFVVDQNSVGYMFGLIAATGLGLGIYYPLPSSAMADLVPPAIRGRALGVYRLFLDLGYFFASIFLISLETIVFPNFFAEIPNIRIFEILLRLVGLIGIVHAMILILFLKDSKPVWNQLSYLQEHIKAIRKLGNEITLGIKAYAEENMEQANLRLKNAKKFELDGDEILMDLTRKTYSGTFPKKDAFELLKIASRVDKAAGNELRGLRRLLKINEPLPKEILDLLVLYSVIELALLEFLEKSIDSLNLGLGVAITRAMEVGNVEELLDVIYRLLWDQLAKVKMKNTFDFISLKDAIELMEKSTNQLEDASEIIRLLGYKYYV
ncbi:MAG: MFS transporter [Methanobacteriota archaeon]|nr:MAG: MFS transporter [Euryarchaeota archaeon]